MKLERIENENVQHANTVGELLAVAHELLRDYPAREIPSELYSADSTIHTNLQSIATERDKLLQLMSLADEYEQTLKEFAQITDVAEDLVDSPISVTSLHHLQVMMIFNQGVCFIFMCLVSTMLQLMIYFSILLVFTMS